MKHKSMKKRLEQRQKDHEKSVGRTNGLPSSVRMLHKPGSVKKY